jgi:hypothetical protein
MNVSRRTFVGGIAAGAAAAVTLPAADAQAVYMRSDWHTAEFDKLLKSTARVRQIFDAKQIADGGFLPQMKNAFNGFHFGFGIPADQIRIVAALHGPANMMNFDDSMWEKYRLGEYLKVMDPKTSKPAIRNIFFAKKYGPATDPNDKTSLFQDTSIEALQSRGMQLLSCHNSTEAQVHILTTELSIKGAVEEIVADLQAHMLPGAIAVPAMVAAISLLQSEGHYTYLSS